MENEQPKAGSAPDYKGDGIAVWKNTKKDGELYLSIQLFGSKGVKVNAFKYQHKPKEVPNL